MMRHVVAHPGWARQARGSGEGRGGAHRISGLGNLLRYEVGLHHIRHDALRFALALCAFSVCTDDASLFTAQMFGGLMSYPCGEGGGGARRGYFALAIDTTSRPARGIIEPTWSSPTRLLVLTVLYLSTNGHNTLKSARGLRRGGDDNLRGLLEVPAEDCARSMHAACSRRWGSMWCPRKSPLFRRGHLRVGGRGPAPCLSFPEARRIRSRTSHWRPPGLSS